MPPVAQIQSPPWLLRLSQGHLNLLEECPRKFQHIVLEQLSSPNPPEQQAKMLQGERFHLLLQQWLLQLPIQPLVAEDPQLHQWFEAFQTAAPEILGVADRTAQRYPESDRTLEFQGYLLNVRYDLLVASQHSAKILDWKTYPRPQQRHWLATNWQTRLYLFVLAETSHYLPEQLAMVYWFFQTPPGAANTPQSLSFQYSTQQHEQTREDLNRQLSQLTQWLEGYQQAGIALPQLAAGAKTCESCNFAPRCDRRSVQPLTPSPEQNPAQPSRLLDMAHLPSLAEIQEIPL